MGILSSQTGLSSSAPGSYKTPVAARREALAHGYASNVCWFDAEEDLDSEDGSISPVSDQSPLKSGTRWARFFPELSSHFSLVLPVSTITPATSLSSSETLLFNNPRHHAPDDVRQKVGCSWLSPNELDSASSCYSRRSSVSTLHSDSPGPASKSAITFSIFSSADASIFDDPRSTRRAHSRPLTKKLSAAELRHKPLPREPAIRMTPLSVRHPKRPDSPASTSGDGSISAVNLPAGEHKVNGRSTLTVVTEDLENTLAGITGYPDSPTIPLHILNEPLQTRDSPKVPLYILNEPLQISRGNMEMVPSRPAPQPPVDMRRKRKVEARDEGKSRRKNKGSFYFNLPGFSRKYSYLHSRSFSGPTMRSEAESSTARAQEDSNSKERRRKDDIAGLPRFPNPNQIQKPLSKSIERELRWQLPRLQIKETESVGQKYHEKEATAELKLLERAQNLEKTTSLAKGQNHDTLNEKIFVSSTKITAPAPDDVSHKMHEAQAPEAIYELEGGVPELSSKPIISDCQLASQMLANLPDKVVLSLLCQACSLDDLFRFAIITKQFYRVFKQHELELIKSAVFTMSPPAWELREMSPPWSTEWQILVDPDTPVPEYTPALYLQRYAQDIYTLTQLKLLILTRCETFLRPETIRGLSGRDDARAADIDEAFWRIWTFCRIFGCGKSREGDIVGQVDWLNGGVMAVSDDKHGAAASVTEPFGMYNVLFEPPSGFGRGNGGGLSNDQLYNMTEIWTCLGVLLQPIHGRCKEAREAGIFAGHQVAEHDNARAETVLEEWTYYILTLGPSAVLNMASIGPGGCAAAFRRAQLIGLAKWEHSESGTSRSSFLKEAVSKAYRPRCDSPQRGSSQIPQGISRSFGHTTSPSTISSNAVRLQLENDRRRQGVYAEQLRNQRRQPQKIDCHSFADERPISKYSFIMSRLEGIPYEQRPPVPSPATMASYVARAPNVQCPPKPLPIYQPQVRDPVDQAMDMMVRELGFKEDDAKWALKITDTGEGINANAAVSLLLREHQNFQRNDNVVSMCAYRSNSLLSSVISSPESMNSVWRWA